MVIIFVREVIKDYIFCAKVHPYDNLQALHKTAVGVLFCISVVLI